MLPWNGGQWLQLGFRSSGPSFRNSSASGAIAKDCCVARGSIALLDDPYARLEADRYYRLHRAALDLSGDAALGLHMAEYASVGSFSLVGHMAAHCRKKMRSEYGPAELGTAKPFGMPPAPHPWCAGTPDEVSDLVEYLLTL